MTERWFIALLMLTASACAEESAAPAEVARGLLEVYGGQLDDLTYIPALAVHCRGRYATLMGQQQYQDDVHKLLEPFSQGIKPAKADSHVAIAGHLALVGDMERQFARQIQAAAASIPKPKNEEMSDAVFMCGPIQCEAGRITKDEKYFNAAIGYLAEMRRLRQRKDGLYAHGHLCDAAWGRGNGFPAVGIAWCLTLLPENQPGREALLRAYQAHMEELLNQQDAGGMWRQVIDVPHSKPEFTATCMIGFALQRGITQRWLTPEKHQAAVDKAWGAICQRIKPEGKLQSVCESTGTQPNLEAYLARKLNDGVDQRGGSMALLFATERMAAVASVP